MKLITESEKQTMAFAEELAGSLKGGEVLALVGNLGAGKTVFAKGMARGLGIKANICSPTFNIMKLYKIPAAEKKSAIKTFCHIDAYRVNEDALKNIGVLDYFGNKDVVVLVEWADRATGILPDKTIFINISHGGQKNSRNIRVDRL